MSRTARVLSSAAVAVAALALAAPVAGAETIVSANACYSRDGDTPQYGDLPLQLTATATQNGRQLDVSAIQPSVTVPAWLPAKLSPYVGYFVVPGNYSVKVDAWMGVAVAGSTDAPKMLTVTGAVKLAVGGSIGALKLNGITLTLGPTAATSWHVPDAGGKLTLAQGTPGSLPSISGVSVQPTGSLFIRGNYNNLLNLLIDCQPGSTGGDGQTLTPTFTASASTPILSSTFSAYTPPAPTPTPTPVATPAPTPVATPAPTPTPAPTTKPLATGTLATGTLAIASPSLKFGSAAVLVNVSCPAGGTDCTGSAVITSAKKLKVGKGSAKVRKLAAGRYSVKAGTTVPVKVKLSADGKRLRKTALVATVTLKPDAGTVVAKNLRANG